MSEIHLGDSLSVLRCMRDNQFDMCVTSPPYFGLRDYQVDGQLGIEKTPEEYISNLVSIFGEVKRTLKDSGTLWVNIGDSYAGNCSVASNNGRAGFGTKRETVTNRIPDGLKPKDMIGIPWMLAFALRADGWYLRQDIIWAKPNPMPESVKDRCTKSHEYMFLLSKSRQYYYDANSIKEKATSSDTSNRDRDLTRLNNTPGRARMGGLKHNTYTTKNKRDVWVIPTRPSSVSHFASYPTELIRPCILAGCPKGGVVLDPFFGSGTTGVVCVREGREYVGIEINQEYIDISTHRLASERNSMGFRILESWVSG